MHDYWFILFSVSSLRFTSCYDLLLSRFCAWDYKPHHICGIKINRIIRIHNRALRQCFQDKVHSLLCRQEPSPFSQWVRHTLAVSQSQTWIYIYSLVCILFWPEKNKIGLNRMRQSDLHAKHMVRLFLFLLIIYRQISLVFTPEKIDHTDYKYKLLQINTDYCKHNYFCPITQVSVLHSLYAIMTRETPID